MEAKDIHRLYNDKSNLTALIFCDSCTTLIMEFIEDNKLEYDLYDLTVLAHNITLFLLKLIIENPEYYEKELGIKKRERAKLQKDLDSLSPIELLNPELLNFFEYRKIYTICQLP